MKIANKISLSFFTTALILTIIAGTIFYRIAKNNLEKSIYNSLAATVISRSNHIETYFEMLKISVGQLSKSTDLENFLKIKSGEAFEIAMKMIVRTKEANPAIAEFLLLDKTGKVLVSSNESSIGLDESTDTYFLGGQKGIYIKDVYYSEALKEPLIAVSAPFLDSQTGEFLGVLVARVRLNGLNNIVADKTGLGDAGEIYIVNKSGFMVTPSRFIEDTVLKQRVDTKNVRQARLHKGREHVSAQDIGIDVFPDYRGVQVLGANGYIPEMQWAVLAEINAKEAFQPLAKMLLIFLAILFTVPLAAWLLGTFLAMLINSPLHRLHKGTEIIGSGNLDCKVGTNAKDEVGQLSRAFDTMTQNLKKTTASIDSLNKEIAERKRAEEAMRESEQKFKTIFEGAIDGMLLADIQTRKFYMCNRAMSEMLGYEPDEMKRIGIDEIHPKDALPHVLEQVRKQAAKEITIADNLPVKKKNGSVFYADIAASPLQVGGKPCLLGIFRDITERKKAEQRQAQLLKEVEIANLELKDFAYIVSHDLKAPLRAVKVLVDWLSTDYADKLDEDGKEQMRLLTKRVDRMHNLIDGIMQYSRIGRTKEQNVKVDLNELVPEVIDLLAPPANITITTQANLPTILCDKIRISQVFQNLLSNAVKFMDKPNGQVEVACVEENGFWKFSVADNGPGIEEQYFEKIFQMFQTLASRDDYESTGVGLTVAKKIVEMFGGKIWVESKVGHGSTFFFTLSKQPIEVKDEKLFAGTLS